MKISLSTASSLFFGTLLLPTKVAYAQCAPDALEFSDTMALKVEKVGSIPAVDTGAFSYNMQVMDNFDGDFIYFLDQNNGLIYSYNTISSETKTIFDMESSPIPAGLTLDWPYGGASGNYRVKSMTQGTASDEVIVVFTSSTLPTGWSEADAPLPPPNAYGQWVCAPDKGQVWMPDIYRPGLLPTCFANGGGLLTFTAYDVFYKYKLVNGELTYPVPFFVTERPVMPGHLGGGIITTDQGILWSSGDCTLFGCDGSYAPQLDFEFCGKILLLDPEKKGEYKVVAKGVRNSQQMRLFTQNITKSERNLNTKSERNLKAKTSKGTKKSKKTTSPTESPTETLSATTETYLAFMDIGGVTAEEVNAVSLSQLLDDSEVTNFGWGRNMHDGKAREGTYYVNAGIQGVLGTEPSCASPAPIEPGFIQPWTQFGRSAVDYYYAISGLALPTSGTDKLKLLWSEFNTGNLLGTDEAFVEGAAPAKGYKLKLYDSEGNYLESGLNDFVKEELGEVGYYRGDPRLFHYPDGQAGVFIERTGVFYKLTEIAL